MFGIGTGELLLIFIVALIVLGPQKLPEIAAKLGKAYGTFRRLSTQFQRTLNSEIADLEEDKKRVSIQKESTNTINSENDTNTTKEITDTVEGINYETEVYEDISDDSIKKFVTPPTKEESTSTPTPLDNAKATEEENDSPKIPVEKLTIPKKESPINQEKNTKFINDTNE